MFFPQSTAFGVYSKRAIWIMATELYASLKSLHCFRFQIGLYLGSNLVALLVLWLLYAQLDTSVHLEGELNHIPTGEDNGAALESEHNSASVQDKTLSDNSARQASSGIQVASTLACLTVAQTEPRNAQSNLSFLELRLTDTSNRSLQNSIWAMPRIESPYMDKTPILKTHHQKEQREAKGIRAKYRRPLESNDLCSNQAEHHVEELTLQEKMSAFEWKNIGIPSRFESVFQPLNGGPPSLDRHRSYPKLRHSVLAWWAGVEQEKVSGELPKEPDATSDFEEYRFAILDEKVYAANDEFCSDCSVCEVIHPWDSRSAAVHDVHVANDQDRTPTRTRRIFSNYNPTAIVPSAGAVHWSDMRET
ncbi:hypothetical protein AX15_001209 [Amanita polypyramis BW_CC]|nr:hypothetical protein AX15_001209 [Amanita polypyramis BW_CC]